MDNVTTDLDHLANKIKEALHVTGEGWVQANMTLCFSLAEARDQFAGHQDFHQWLHIKDINMEKNERAAAIAMGRGEAAFLRQVLEKTTRRSLRYIFENEYKTEDPSRFPYLGKTKDPPKPEPAKPAEAPQPTKKSKKSEARVDYDQRLREAKAEIKDKAKEELDIRVKEAIAKERDKLEREYQHRLEELKKREKRAMLRLSSTDGTIPIADDKLIIKCLHPDHVSPLGPEVVAMHDAGFKAYSKWRDFIIVKPPEK